MALATVEVTDRLVETLDRLHNQEGCSTKRRDRFTITRYELESLLALRTDIRKSINRKGN